MTSTVVAAVQTGARAIELVELPRPKVGRDDAILRVEACGICGTDVEQYRGEMDGVIDLRYPLVPGHEPVGIIDEIGVDAAERWGLDVGDRVAVEPFVPCGSCRYCLSGAYEHCDGWPQMMAYGFISTGVAPGIWGGYATHLYLHPKAVLHRVPAAMPADLAVLFNPLGAGIRWGVTLPGTTIGSIVLVLGPGQRGLATAAAAKVAGARTVIVTGLSRDRHKLDLALALGADHVIDVESEDLVPRVRDITGGAMADIVVDVTANATQPVVDAIDAVRPGGTIVLAGLKGTAVSSFPSDKLVLRGITVIGARGVTAPAYRDAIDLLAADRLPLDRLRTHVFPLAEAERAIQTLAGEVIAGEILGEHAINVVIAP
jgi:threonine dehydrogenase-like Zn-dependent dehydrogenase